MPVHEGLGFDHHQGVSPGEESRPQDQRKTSGGGELAGWNSVFLIEGKLLAQEQYFGTQGSPGRKCQSQEMGALGDGSNKDKNQRSEQLFVTAAPRNSVSQHVQTIGGAVSQNDVLWIGLYKPSQRRLERIGDSSEFIIANQMRRCFLLKCRLCRDYDCMRQRALVRTIHPNPTAKRSKVFSVGRVHSRYGVIRLQRPHRLVIITALGLMRDKYRHFNSKLLLLDA